jgi:hypothetical protein
MGDFEMASKNFSKFHASPRQTRSLRSILQSQHVFFLILLKIKSRKFEESFKLSLVKPTLSILGTHIFLCIDAHFSVH